MSLTSHSTPPAPAPRRDRRPAPPEAPVGEILLQSPPLLPKGSGQGAMQMMFMLPMMLGMGAMSFVYIGRAGGADDVGVRRRCSSASMVGMVVMSAGRAAARAKKAQINDERRDYLRYLAGLRGQVRQVATRQREAHARTRCPNPTDLWASWAPSRMWAPPAPDPDFGRVRVGTGPQRLATPLRAPQTAPLEDLDPVSSTSLRHFIRTYATVPDLPVAVSLRVVRPDRRSAATAAAALDLARAMVAAAGDLPRPRRPADRAVPARPDRRRRSGSGSSGCRTPCDRRAGADATGPGSGCSPDSLATLAEPARRRSRRPAAVHPQRRRIDRTSRTS